jgi:lactate dehydrogenase-like 2-hydroxyacid dehydrogenase
MLLCNRTSFPSTATEIADCDVVISLLPFSQSSRDTVQKLGSSWSKDGHPIPLLVNVGELSVYSVCPLEMFQTRVIDWCDAVEPIMPESSKWWSVPNTIVTPHVASGQAKVEELAKAWQTVTKTDVLTW